MVVAIRGCDVCSGVDGGCERRRTTAAGGLYPYLLFPLWGIFPSCISRRLFFSFEAYRLDLHHFSYLDFIETLARKVSRTSKHREWKRSWELREGSARDKRIPGVHRNMTGSAPLFPNAPCRHAPHLRSDTELQVRLPTTAHTYMAETSRLYPFNQKSFCENTPVCLDTHGFMGFSTTKSYRRSN